MTDGVSRYRSLTLISDLTLDVYAMYRVVLDGGPVTRRGEK